MSQGGLPISTTPGLDARLIERVARCFDARERLTRWPAKRSEQILVLWALWSRLPSGTVHTEQGISALLKNLHDFGDHALLRRELVELGLLSRTGDCREYRRIERALPIDAAKLISTVAEAGVS